MLVDQLLSDLNAMKCALSSGNPINPAHINFYRNTDALKLAEQYGANPNDLLVNFLLKRIQSLLDKYNV